MLYYQKKYILFKHFLNYEVTLFTIGICSSLHFYKKSYNELAELSWKFKNVFKEIQMKDNNF